MSEIKIYSFLILTTEGAVKALERLGYTVGVNEEGPGYVRITTTPDLTIGHKAAVQKAIDATGYGVITP